MLLKFRDFMFEESFMKDFDEVPEEAVKRVRKRVEYYVDYFINGFKEDGWAAFPNSLNAHTIEGTDVWIGYLTKSRQAWRVLFVIDDDDILHFWRLFNHKQMDTFIKNFKYK